MRTLCLILATSVAVHGAPDDKARKTAIRKGIAHLEERVFRLPDAAGTPRKILRILTEAQQANGGWGHGRINPANKDPFQGRIEGGYKLVDFHR